MGVGPRMSEWESPDGGGGAFGTSSCFLLPGGGDERFCSTVHVCHEQMYASCAVQMNGNDCSWSCTSKTMSYTELFFLSGSSQAFPGEPQS